MAVITIKLEDTQVAGADALAAELSREYGVPVSRSEVFRRAIDALLTSRRSLEVSLISEEIKEVAAMTKDIRRNKAERCYDVYVNGRCVARNFERYAEAEAYADKYVYDALVHGATA